MSDLPKETQDYIESMKKTIPSKGTRLGSLVRRFEMAARSLHEGIEQFGGPVVIGHIAGKDVTVPVKCGATLTLDIEVNGQRQTWQVPVGQAPSAAPPPTPSPVADIAHAHGAATASSTAPTGARVITI